jgi:hypothetical protein
MKFKLIAFCKAKHIASALSLFSFGLICGAVLTNLVIGYQLDRLMFSYQQLQNQYTEAKDRLHLLEDKLQKTTSPVWIVKEIKVNISFSEQGEENYDNLYHMELEKRISELLKNAEIIGEEVIKLDGKRITSIIDGRIFMIDGHFFQAKVICTVISEVFTIDVKVIEMV